MDAYLAEQGLDESKLMEDNPQSGMPNAFAYAFDAEDGDKSKLPTPSVDMGADLDPYADDNEQYMVLRYRERRDALHMNITPRASKHLDTLANGFGAVVRVGEPVIDGNSVIHTFRSIDTVGNAGTIFMDVVITFDNLGSAQ